MYGTVMIGTMATGASLDDYDLAAKEWLERRADGFVDEQVMLGDDGKTVVMVVRFRDKAAYLALADSPEQDEWWTTTLKPLLAGDPQWYDGEWVRSYTA